MSVQSIYGVISAVLTPLNDALRPDNATFISYCKHLLEEGCHCLGILGSTGEANSIHISDRLQLIKTAAQHLPPKKLLVGTGACSLKEAIDLSKCAVENGIMNLLVLPPFYYAPVSDEGIAAYYDRLISAVAHPDMRIYLYNFPKLTGYRFTSSLIKDLISRHGETIAGLKDSSGDFDGMKEYISINPAFNVFSGTERYLVDIMDAGGAGCISATINITARHARAVWNSRSAELQDSLTLLRASIEKYPLVPALKTLKEQETGDHIWQNMLPPHVALNLEQKQSLFSDFQNAQKKALKL